MTGTGNGLGRSAKYALSITGAFLLIVIISVMSAAQDADTQWKIEGDVLTISPGDDGVMKNYGDEEKPLWFDDQGIRAVKKLVIENGVTHVGDNAFKFGKWLGGDFALAEIQVADSVTSIGKFSFIGIPTVTLLTVPVNIDLLVDDNGNRDPAFKDTSKIQKIVFTKGGGSNPGEGYNYGNRGRMLSPQYLSREALTDVVFSEGITKTGEDAIYGCYKVTSLTFPGTLNTVGSSQIEGCAALTQVTIPDSVTGIGDYAFKGCTGLTQLTVPANLNLAGTEKFLDVAGLTKIVFTLGSGDTKGRGFDYLDGDKEKTWREHTPMFYSRGVLTEVVFSQGMTCIGASTLYWCEKIPSITVPEGVLTLNTAAFQFCKGMTSVSLPSTLKGVGDYCFGNAEALQAVSVPNTVTYIGIYGFQNCFSLKEMTVPVNVNLSGDHIFENVSNLVKITFLPGTLYEGHPAGEGFNYGHKDDKGDFRERTPMYYSRGVLTEVVFSDGINRIGSSTLYCCENIPSITVPGGVSAIGDAAFEHCKGMTSVSLPDTLTSIEDYAFNDCTGLTALVIPNRVTSLGNYAFKDCTGLTQLTVPVNLNLAGEERFLDVAGLTKIVFTLGSGDTQGRGFDYDNDDDDHDFREHTPMYYSKGVLTEVVFPDGMTRIGSSTLYRCENISSVTVPGGVTSIGGAAFQHCYGMTSVSLQDKLTSIESYAFNDCTGLTALVIPNSVTSLDDHAFGGCTGLTQLTVPANLNLADNRFRDVTGLTKIVFTPGSGDSQGKGYDYSNGQREHTPMYYSKGVLTEVVFSQGMTCIGQSTLYWCENIRSIVVPEGVTTLNIAAFQFCRGMTEITLPSTLEKVDEYCFGNAESLQAVHMSNRVTYIGKYGFQNCFSLKEMTVPVNVDLSGSHMFEKVENLTKITFLPGVDYNGRSAGNGFDYDNDSREETPQYYSRANLREVVYSDGITHIGNSTLYGCEKVVKSNIPYGVKTVGRCAFEGCSSLMQISVPDSLEPDGLGEYVFKNCSSLMLFTVPINVDLVGNSKDEERFYNVTNIRTILFTPGSGKTAGEGRDYNGYSYQWSPQYLSRNMLTGAVLQEGIKVVGLNTFNGCYSIYSIRLPESLVTVGMSSFYGCSGLQGQLLIPENVTVIKEQAFYKCSRLSSLVLTGNVVEIGESAFDGCSGFSNTLTLPNSLVTIGKRQFAGCSGFTGSLFIPNGLSKIQDEMFEDCSGFNGTLTLSGNVTTIGGWAFSGCSGLTGQLTLPASVTAISDCAFEDCSGFTGSLYLPQQLTTLGVYSFLNCTGFNGTLFLPEGITSIGKEQFCGCSGFTGPLMLPSGLTLIADGVFKGCSGFTGTLTIASGVKVDNYAFQNCSGFDGLQFYGEFLKDGDKQKGVKAFQGCTGFTGDLNLTVAVIPDYAFSGCSGFTGILALGPGVKSVGKYAFSGCSGFTSLELRNTGSCDIGMRAFEYCSGFTGQLTLVEDTKVGQYAFAECTGLTGPLVVENNVKIKDSQFRGCINILYIQVKDSDDFHHRAFVSHTFFAEQGNRIYPDNDGFGNHKYYGTSHDDLMQTTEDIKVFLIRYDVDGGSAPAPVQGQLTTGSLFEIQTYQGTKGDDNFRGWMYRDTLYQPGYTLQVGTENITLKAVWEPRTAHNVIYDADGGSAPAPVQAPVLEGGRFTLQDYSGTKAGLVFSGWLYRGDVYAPGTQMRMGSSDMTFIANWDNVPYYRVAYDANGGSADPPVQPSLPSGAVFTVESYQGTKEGYAFNGWVSSGKLYAPGSLMTVMYRDILLVADWLPVRNITYDLNGGEGDAPQQSPVPQGGTFTVQGCTAVKEGYRFDSWSFEGNYYVEGDVITVSYTDIVLKAEWSLVLEKHHVTYDVVGGGSEAPTQEDVEEGMKFQVKDYKGTKDGYEFGGWIYNGEIYIVGGLVTMGTGDIVLTALWKPVESDSTLVTLLICLGAVAAVCIAQMALVMARRYGKI